MKREQNFNATLRAKRIRKVVEYLQAALKRSNLGEITVNEDCRMVRFAKYLSRLQKCLLRMRQ